MLQREVGQVHGRSLAWLRTLGRLAGTEDVVDWLTERLAVTGVREVGVGGVEKGGSTLRERPSG